MTYAFAIEPYAQIIEDMKPMFAEHWRELALYQDSIPLDPDYEFYEAAANAGLLTFFSVRLDGALVGYAVFMGREKNPHYKTTRWMVSDILYIAPDHRHAGVGAGLIRFIEAVFTQRGIHVLHIGTKESSPDLATLLQRLGYERVEAVYGKKLN
jgi:GNAT superfamily N-acetyltransferase